MAGNKLKNRDIYLKKLLAFKDQDIIKVITGIRRCGKSSLMKLMVQHLFDEGVLADHIIEMNFESMQYSQMTGQELYDYVISKKVDGKMYLFFDEVQNIPQWQKAINSFRVDLDCDIYITGSNAFLLSSELSTYLSGRYVEIKMYPLSFGEFLDFCDYKVRQNHTSGIVNWKVTDSKGEIYDIKDLFRMYTMYGGMPGITETQPEQEKVSVLLDGLYSAVIVRDILERGRRKEQRNITDALLLRKITMFLADNIGNNTSAASISNTLSNEGLMDKGKKSKTATHTIQAYIEALVESYIFYDIKRFDIKGKEYLKTLGKYYIVDIGLRNYLLGYRDGDTGHILENVVYFELLKRGYNVAIGKIDNKEIDFIATKTNEKKYIQVTESIVSPETKERELAPLRMVKDNYEKIVITFEGDITGDIDGIKIVKAIDFLLEKP